MTRATLESVASALGISPMTVSRYLSKPESVSAKMRERVNAELKRQHYQPNFAARQLASSRSGVIGIIVPSLANQVFADVVRGVTDALSTALPISVVSTDYDRDAEQRSVDSFENQGAAGIIWVKNHEIDLPASVPVLTIMDSESDVGFDHITAANTAVTHLKRKGAKHIAVLTAGNDPRAGVRSAAARECGATIFSTDQTSDVETGRLLANKALSAGHDGLFCNNDDIALGALFECIAQGISVPAQVQICGFNNLSFSSATEPSLTTIAVPRYEIGQIAGEALLKPRERVMLAPKLVVRGSTRP